MSYPERKPIYEAYETVVKKIVEEKKYKIYAESSIDELDKSILSAFKSIRSKLIVNKVGVFALASVKQFIKSKFFK